MGMRVKNLIAKIAPIWRRFAFRGEKRTQSHVEQIHSRRLTALTPEKQADLEKLCDQLFRKKELITSGKLQLIGLSKVKQHMGKRWVGLSKIVYDTAEDVIDSHLDQGDIFIRYRDDTYIIVFARASLDEGHRKAALIADEIRRRLFALDEEELRSIEIREAIGEIRTDFLKEKGFPDFLDSLSFDLDDAPSQDTEGEIPVAQDDAVPEIDGVDIDASAYRRKKTSTQKSPVSPGEITFSYLPLWDVRRNALTTYLCLARRTGAAGNLFDHYRALYKGHSDENKAAIDRMILDAVRGELASMEKDGRQFLIACPVQHETLHCFDRYEEYKQILAGIPAAQRQYLVFYVLNLDGYLPPKDAYWFAAPLRQFCRHVFAEVPLRRDINFNYLRNTGVDVAGVRLDAMAAAPERETMNLMMAFSTKAKALKIPMTFVLGVPTLSLTTSAVCATFDFLGGPAIHDEVAKPDMVHKYRYEDLLSGFMNLGTK